MQIKQVWMSPDTRDRRPYGLRLLGGMLGIAGLLVLIILGGTAISFYLGLPQKMGALALVLGATALGTVLALGLGRRAVQDATMFFLTGDDRLFAMDARALSDHGHDVLGYAKGAMETQKFLQCLAEQPYIPAGADEILLAKEVRTYRRCHVLRCLVRHPNRQVVPKTYILPKGYAQEKALLCQLDAHSPANAPASASNNGGADDRFFAHSSSFHAVSAAFSCSGVSTEAQTTPGRVFFTKPARALPGPTSRIWSTPSSPRRWSVSSM